MLAVLVVLPVLLLTLLSLSSETEKPLICPGPPPGLGRCGYGDRSPIVSIFYVVVVICMGIRCCVVFVCLFACGCSV